MDNLTHIDGLLFVKMVLAAANRLSKEKADIDSLNVFPVPDGDTGTNMSLTMNSAAKFVGKLANETPDVSQVAEKMAYGALMGARGNSGVILSQILGGFSGALKDKKELTPQDIAMAFENGVASAYKAVAKPMEGTILTVAREAKDYLTKNIHNDMSIAECLRLYLEEGYRSLARTPEILPVLKQAGVVDAGGKGLLTIVEGMLAGLLGEEDFSYEVSAQREEENFVDDHFAADPESIVFQYCTELFIKSFDGNTLDTEPIKAYLSSIGDSLLVVGAGEVTKIHVHTNHPEQVVAYCIALGDLHDVKVENMKIQNYKLQAKQSPMKEVGIIAVSAGDGLNTIFESMGVDMIVSGGQTMNPSTEDFLAAIDKVHAQEVIILPNNKNIILTAEQAAKVKENTKVYVVGSRTIPQGIAAMMAYNIEESCEINAKQMSAALENVRTVEVTYAVRDTSIGEKTIKEGQMLGIVDGKIVAVGNETIALLKDAFETINISQYELVTLYYGKDIHEEEAEELQESLSNIYPDLEFEIYNGAQAVYDYLISVE